MKDWGADIKPGDCVVAFSRRKLFQLKNEIEVATAQRPTAQRLRCCVVYGALPPEARREQARLFNGVCGLGARLNALKGSAWSTMNTAHLNPPSHHTHHRNRRDLGLRRPRRL